MGCLDRRPMVRYPGRGPCCAGTPLPHIAALFRSPQGRPSKHTSEKIVITTTTAHTYNRLPISRAPPCNQPSSRHAPHLSSPAYHRATACSIHAHLTHKHHTLPSPHLSNYITSQRFYFIVGRRCGELFGVLMDQLQFCMA